VEIGASRVKESWQCSNARRPALQSLDLSVRPRLLLGAQFYKSRGTIVPRRQVYAQALPRLFYARRRLKKSLDYQISITAKPIEF